MKDTPCLFGFIHSIVYKNSHRIICPNSVLLLYYLWVICRKGKRNQGKRGTGVESDIKSGKWNA